jgi:gamma-glutamyltranspeptidase/glutathione hydrolase
MLAIVLVAPLVLAARPQKTHPTEVPPAPVARGKAGLVVSAHPLASSAGLDALKHGGNAMDAAVAAAFAITVVEQYHAGIGGGGFLLYYDAKSKKISALDFRETAPKGARRDMYIVDGKYQPSLSQEGITSVAVPSMVPGLEEAEKRFGAKKFKDVVGPAVKIADEGFLVYKGLHIAIAQSWGLLKKNEACAKIFLHPDGEPYAVGERLVQKDLAKTLRDLGRDGARLFTEGKVAQAIAKASKDEGGVLTLDDLKSVKPRSRDPLVGTYRGHTIVTMPPPSSGFILLEILKMREIDLMKRQVTGNRMSADDAHFLIEIERRAFADRATFGGDPAFVDVPVQKLLSDDYMKTRYLTIDPVRATPSSDVKAGLAGPWSGKALPIAKTSTRTAQKHTTHLIAIDKDGNLATMTFTVNNYFGSGICVPGTGVVLNDEMDDFASAPGEPNAFGLVGGDANSIQPGKVPLSSMVPTIVLKDGRLLFSAGAPGGSTIITTVAQIVMNVIDRQMDVAHAVAEPRIHMQWLPDEVILERNALSKDIRADLQKRGYRLNTERKKWGNASAVEVYSDGTRYGAADPRGDGGGDAE